MQVTFKYRIKDKHQSRLASQARAVNFVWNYANETQQKAARSGRPWLSGHDLWKLVAGATKEGLDLHSHSAMRVCQEYARSRQRDKKPWLRWRGRKSLGWVPFNTGHVAFRDGAFVFRGEIYRVWLHRPLPAGAKIGAGSFNADNKGRWYINVPVEVAESDVASLATVGIDLGLHSLATLSTGTKIEPPRLYRKSEAALATAQRARKTKRARAIRAKAANRRKDFLHKESSKLTKQFGLIVVGDVSPSKLAKTSMAKSVLDAGWSDFRRMLSYKAIMHGGRAVEVSENLTTQACSCCGSLPHGRPKGIAGLGIREWTCGDCGSIHDRDVNAARNILARGLASLAGGAHV